MCRLGVLGLGFIAVAWLSGCTAGSGPGGSDGGDATEDSGGADGRQCLGAREPCTDTGQCCDGLQCDPAEGRCTSSGDCGGFDEPCCTSGEPCEGTDLACGADDTCQRCGGQSQPCCEGESCNAALTCEQGFCAPEQTECSGSGCETCADELGCGWCAEGSGSCQNGQGDCASSSYYSSAGNCPGASCAELDQACDTDDDCCHGKCGVDDTCTCIPNGDTGCSSAEDCCSDLVCNGDTCGSGF